METKERLQRAIDYIESNLNKNLSIDQIADYSNFSPYHFQRLFKKHTEFSIKDYMLQRRLSDSASRLICTPDKILDIALDNHFKNHESFTRAFKRHYNETPLKFRNNQKIVEHFEKLNILKNYFHNESMKKSPHPKLVTLQSFNIIGIEITTTIKDCLHYEQSRELWLQFITDRLSTKIPNIMKPVNCIGLCTNFNIIDQTYNYLIGYRVKHLSVVPPGMVGKIVPSTKYVVFEGNGLPDSIHESWHNSFYWKNSSNIYSKPENYLAFEYFDTNWPLEFMTRKQRFDFTGYRMKEITPYKNINKSENYKMRVYHSLHGGVCTTIK